MGPEPDPEPEPASDITTDERAQADEDRVTEMVKKKFEVLLLMMHHSRSGSGGREKTALTVKDGTGRRG